MKVFSIVMICLLGVVLLYLATLILVGFFSFRLSMSSKSIAKHLAKANTVKNYDVYKIDHSWWDKQPCQELQMLSYDGLKLFGHFIEGKNKNLLAILVHGYGGDYKDLNSFADLFLKRGYSVLAIECRAHGKSEGKMIGMGWLDRIDLEGWINLMLEKNPNYKIVLFGQSMGAATVCMALGDKLPDNIVCAISDCGYDNVYRQFYHVCKNSLKFMARPTLNIFYNYMKRTKDFDIKHADTISQLKKSKVPVLFIHGKADEFVPVEMCYRMSAAVPEERRQVLLVEGAGHIMSYGIDEVTYTKTVKNFLSKYNM